MEMSDIKDLHEIIDGKMKRDVEYHFKNYMTSQEKKKS